MSITYAKKVYDASRSGMNLFTGFKMTKSSQIREAFAAAVSNLNKPRWNITFEYALFVDKKYVFLKQL